MRVLGERALRRSLGGRGKEPDRLTSLGMAKAVFREEGFRHLYKANLGVVFFCTRSAVPPFYVMI